MTLDLGEHQMAVIVFEDCQVWSVGWTTNIVVSRCDMIVFGLFYFKFFFDCS